jgi:hypothetical protein
LFCPFELLSLSDTYRSPHTRSISRQTPNVEGRSTSINVVSSFLVSSRDTSSFLASTREWSVQLRNIDLLSHLWWTYLSYGQRNSLWNVRHAGQANESSLSIILRCNNHREHDRVSYVHRHLDTFIYYRKKR